MSKRLKSERLGLGLGLYNVDLVPYHFRPTLQDLSDLFLGDVKLSLSDLFHLLGVGNDDLDTHLHLMFLEIEIQQSDFYPSCWLEMIRLDLV